MKQARVGCWNERKGDGGVGTKKWAKRDLILFNGFPFLVLIQIKI
jgi:hypothetical protein